MGSHLSIFITCAAAVFGSASPGKELKPLGPVKFSGDLKGAKDISAISKIGSFLVIGSDEAVGQNDNLIQLLKKGSAGQYEVHRNIVLFKGNKKHGKEMDIEGIAAEDDKLYVVGSHSSRRRRIDKNKKYKTNREIFWTRNIDDARNRDWLHRLTIDSQGKDSANQKISLRNIIKNDRVLKVFSEIPSKENGIDIEGIAAKGSWLFIGFRGPVFRGNYVPVMKLKFDDPRGTYRLLYVKLGGRGIRDITHVSDGFLIVAGPVGDGQDSYQLYHWDGKDTIPGKDIAAKHIGKLRLLGEIWRPNGSKVEGIVVLQEKKASYELIVVYDGVKKEVAQLFHVLKEDKK